MHSHAESVRLWRLRPRGYRRAAGDAVTIACCAPGNALRGTDGVPTWPASQSSEEVNASWAKGQLCIPGTALTAHATPWILPSAHKATAAWLSAPASSPAELGPALVDTKNDPNTSRYRPCL